MCSTLPSFLHGMFVIKQLPGGSGNTLEMLALLLFASQGPESTRSTRWSDAIYPEVVQGLAMMSAMMGTLIILLAFFAT